MEKRIERIFDYAKIVHDRSTESIARTAGGGFNRLPI